MVSVDTILVPTVATYSLGVVVFSTATVLGSGFGIGSFLYVRLLWLLLLLDVLLVLLPVFLPNRGRVEVEVDFETANLTMACFVVDLADFCFEMLDRAVLFVLGMAEACVFVEEMLRHLQRHMEPTKTYGASVSGPGNTLNDGNERVPDSSAYPNADCARRPPSLCRPLSPTSTIRKR